MSSHQYRKSHFGDKTVVRSSYLHNGISCTGKTTYLYWIRPKVTDSVETGIENVTGMNLSFSIEMFIRQGFSYLIHKNSFTPRQYVSKWKQTTHPQKRQCQEPTGDISRILLIHVQSKYHVVLVSDMRITVHCRQRAYRGYPILCSEWSPLSRGSPVYCFPRPRTGHCPCLLRMCIATRAGSSVPETTPRMKRKMKCYESLLAWICSIFENEWKHEFCWLWISRKLSVMNRRYRMFWMCMTIWYARSV